MARIINLSDKFDMAASKIQIGEKEYVVSDSITTMFKVQELMTGSTTKESILEAITVALGTKAATEINIDNMNYKNLQILIAAIFAIITDVDYEVAAERFQDKSKK